MTGPRTTRASDVVHVFGITAKADGCLVDLRREFGPAVEFVPCRRGARGQVDAASLPPQTVALIVADELVSAAEVAALPSALICLGRAGVGVDNIDVAAARERGLVVFNEPAVSTAEVATHTAALILALDRQLLALDGMVRGGWDASRPHARPPLDEQRLGVVGLGRIGSRVARLLGPFVREVRTFDIAPERSPTGMAVDSLPQLLAMSDILTLHVPLTEGTRHFVDETGMQSMPAGALVVNTARGGILEEDGLVRQLELGHLGGAGLDVFDEEPLPAGHRLARMANVVMTPHWGAVSTRSALRRFHWPAQDALDYLHGRPLRHGTIL